MTLKDKDAGGNARDRESALYVDLHEHHHCAELPRRARRGPPHADRSPFWTALCQRNAEVTIGSRSAMTLTEMKVKSLQKKSWGEDWSI